MPEMPMRLRLAALVLACLAPLAAGACKNSPDNVCKRFVALEVQKLAKHNKDAITSDMKKTEEANCVAQMEAMKKDAPNQYACQAACVNDVQDIDDLDPCFKKCPKNE
jgi:hypothetical protein